MEERSVAVLGLTAFLLNVSSDFFTATMPRVRSAVRLSGDLSEGCVVLAGFVGIPVPVKGHYRESITFASVRLTVAVSVQMGGDPSPSTRVGCHGQQW